jgi:hypothetical protein
VKGGKHLTAAADPNRWTDDRIDDLAGRVDDLEVERHSIRELTSKVGDLAGHVDTLTEVERRAREDSVRRQGQIDHRFDQLEQRLERRFDKVDNDHASSARTLRQIKEPDRSPFDRFKDTMAWLGPIIVALIGAYVLLKTGAPGPQGPP